MKAFIYLLFIFIFNSQCLCNIDNVSPSTEKIRNKFSYSYQGHKFIIQLRMNTESYDLYAAVQKGKDNRICYIPLHHAKPYRSCWHARLSLITSCVKKPSFNSNNLMPVSIEESVLKTFLAEHQVLDRANYMLRSN